MNPLHTELAGPLLANLLRTIKQAKEWRAILIPDFFALFSCLFISCRCFICQIVGSIVNLLLLLIEMGSQMHSERLRSTRLPKLSKAKGDRKQQRNKRTSLA